MRRYLKENDDISFEVYFEGDGTNYSLYMDMSKSYVYDKFSKQYFYLNDLRLENIDKDFINNISFIINRTKIFDHEYELITENQSWIFTYHAHDITYHAYCSLYIGLHFIKKILNNHIIRCKVRKSLENNKHNITYYAIQFEESIIRRF